MAEPMSDERWEECRQRLRREVGKQWSAWIEVEMDRLREENKALRAERDKWMTLADPHALTTAYLLGASKPLTPDPPKEGEP